MITRQRGVGNRRAATTPRRGARAVRGHSPERGIGDRCWTVDNYSMGMTTVDLERGHAGHRGAPVVAVALALAYTVLAVAFAGTVVGVAAGGLQGPIFLLVAAFVAMAYAVERASHRAANVLAKNVAPTLYLGAALFLPAPSSIVIAVIAVVACHLTWSGASTVARVAATAHTAVVVTAMTLLTYLAFGDARLIRAVQAFVTGAGQPMRVAVPAPIYAGAHVTAGLPHATTLVGLALAFYLLDTVPLTIIGALFRRTSPLRAWLDLYARNVAVEIAVPSLVLLAAVTYVASAQRAVVGLALPLGLALHAALERRPLQHHNHDATEQVADAPALGSRSAAPDDDIAMRFDAVLYAVRALGGNGELAEVTLTLARAAVRLTSFRSCVVYLYESRDGTFVPYACNDEGTADARTLVPREMAASLMATESLLGYSYYTRVPREEGAAPERWRAGDVLVVPLLMKTGDVTGFLWLDAPSDGQAPEADDLAPLETIARLGAGVIARLRHTDEVMHLAQTDSLTGLLNRRAFEERLGREVQGNAFRRPVALMMIDLDDFGSINNTYGHQIGDEALRLVAGVIRAHLRQSDAGGRYGGDEFVIILPELDAAAAIDVAERVRVALVDATVRAAAEGRLPQLHTSIGVAVFPHDGTSGEALIKAADDALYSSKRLGKNRVSLRGAA